MDNLFKRVLISIHYRKVSWTRILMSHFLVNDSSGNHPSTHSHCADHVDVNGLGERVSNAAEENSHCTEVALSLG